MYMQGLKKNLWSFVAIETFGILKTVEYPFSEFLGTSTFKT